VFNLSQFIFFVIGCLATFALVCLLLPHLFTRQKKFYPKRVITAFESRMFTRLKDAFPHHHILAQVAFSALITHDQMKMRNQFNRKVTDFVVLDREYNVVAIVELDDPSHIGKEQEDAERDAMLIAAGYTVIRYTQIPTIRQLQRDLK
jgi:very-short-patch-repair endonuclease